MKKSKVIELVKKGKLAVHMNRKEPKDIELLREILKEAFPNDESKPYGSQDFYEKMDGYDEWDYHYDTNNQTIKITEIKQEETFESGELVEVVNCRGVSCERIYRFTTITGYIVTEDKDGVIEQWVGVSKINPAIEQIREIMKKNNISKEEI
jgi:hypothetical protein